MQAYVDRYNEVKVYQLYFFRGVYFHNLSVYYVSIDIGKRLPQLYCIKMKTCYDPCCIKTLELPWQCNDLITFFTCLCVSRHYRVFFQKSLKGA